MAITSNMGLTLPDVSVTPGPTWASQINSDLSLIDSHNHVPSSGGGVPITTAALQIDEDLNFNTVRPYGAAANGLSQVGLLAPIGTQPVPTRIVSGSDGEMYYIDASGIPTKITDNGSVAAAQGNITNLVSPASAVFNVGSGTFRWEKNTSRAAGMDCGPLSIRSGMLNAPAVSIVPSNSMSAGYTLTLPVSVTSGQRIVTASSGFMSFTDVDSTLSLTSSTLKVAASGITDAQLSSNSVSTVKIQDQAVTQSKLAARVVYHSPGVTSVYTNSTNFGAALQVTGAQLRLYHNYKVEVLPTGIDFARLYINATAISSVQFDLEVAYPTYIETIPLYSFDVFGDPIVFPPTALSFWLESKGVGPTTITLRWRVSVSSTSALMENVQLAVYEI